jgi:hypothetical protein
MCSRTEIVLQLMPPTPTPPEVDRNVARVTM